MKVLSIRFCSVSEEALPMAEFFDALGLERKQIGELESEFSGVVFPAGDSWIEIWKMVPGLPAGVMLQIVVDDADVFAEHAQSRGLQPQGPVEEHGERIFFLKAPNGLAVSFQSKVES